jgi:hypothetical protein
VVIEVPDLAIVGAWRLASTPTKPQNAVAV